MRILVQFWRYGGGTKRKMGVNYFSVGPFFMYFLYAIVKIWLYLCDWPDINGVQIHKIQYCVMSGDERVCII